jgi:hypothetical protein
VPLGVDRPQGKYFNPDTHFTESKSHYEKRHLPEKAKETTQTLDNRKLTMVKFDCHNK